MAQKFFASMGTASWIDPATKLFKVDPVAPAANIPRSFLSTDGDQDRFSNYLEVYIDVDAGKITNGGFTSASDIYRSKSAFGLDSVKYETRRSIVRAPDFYTFTQVVGARTHSPETGGEVVGGALGGLPGYIIGKYTAKKIFSYPPIWSELVIKFFSAGLVDAQVMRHSLFPSLTAYRQDGNPGPQPASSLHRIPSVTGAPYYDANANLPAWQKRGWGALRGGSIGPTPGNPWSAELTDS